MSTTANQFLEAAIAQARAGRPTFPIKPRRKEPLGELVPNGCHDATTDLAILRQWWAVWPDANNGMACGRGTNVVDIDPRAGGQETLARLEAEHGALPATLTVKTGDGEHRYFAAPIGTPGREFGPGVSFRGAGQYVVGPGSIHPSGARYEVVNDLPIARAPDWLLRAATSGNRGDKQERLSVEDVLKGVPKGERDRTLFRLASKLRRTDVPYDWALRLVMEAAANCAPPFPASEARKKVDNAYGRYKPEHEPTLTFSPNGHAGGAEESGEDPETPVHHTEASVNARVKPVSTGKVDENGREIFQQAAAWVDKHQPVKQMTWAPGEPQIIRDRLISQGGWISRAGCTVFNLYRPPTIKLGDRHKADRWIELVHIVYPTEAEHIITWLAHRVQRPGEKINHALVLGGEQGIGKDTILEPVKSAIGPWNFEEVSPAHLLGRFNGFIKSVILRVSEARDLGDVDRYGFYEHMKIYTAAPPDALRCDEKNRHEYSVPNVCGVIITTNHKTNGIYIPADDRRHFVAWSDCTGDTFNPNYWTELYQWFDNGGREHIAAYLASLDISDFNPKAPPRKTVAFWDIVDANRAPEDAELSDVLDQRFWPEAVTLTEIINNANESLAEWLKDRRNSRQIPHRLEAVGWKIGGKNQVVYACKELSERDRQAAARALAESR